jgi:hypothetical protein
VEAAGTEGGWVDGCDGGVEAARLGAQRATQHVPEAAGRGGDIARSAGRERSFLLRAEA